MIGDINKSTPISAYQPSSEVRDFTIVAKKDYGEGVRILERGWTELNDRSVIEDENHGKMMFNAYVDTSVEDPNEAWKWRGTRSMARNKGIAMHAQFMGNFLLPQYVAQNEDDEIDRDFSEVMRDIVEWMCDPTNYSNYQSSYLQVGFGMLTNPVTYLGAEFYEIYQTIKEKTAKGYEKKEVLDEVLSGFKCPIYSSSQILITNPYERSIQKQRAIIKRRYVEYDEMEAKYGEHENWPYVTKGIKSIYSEEDGLFYDIKDDDHPNLVAEEIHQNRREDSEVPFVNGIYLGDADVNHNPIRHRDNRNCPKYNVVPFGYMRIGEHFFYYKSMMNAMGWDNMAYDAMSEIVYNRAVLENEMPVGISGSDEVNSGVMFPNSVVTFENPDTKITPLLPQSNIVAGFNALREVEKSMSEGSLNDTLSGQLPDASQKAFNVAQAQANAKKNIGDAGKSLVESMVQVGDLMKDIALNHVTTAQIEELVGGKMKMKYKTFLLQNKKSGGKMADRKIKLDDSLVGLELSKEALMERKMQLLETTDYPHSSPDIKNINPALFPKFKFLTKIDVQEIFTKSNEYWQPILQNLKVTLAQDPYIDQLALDRKYLYSIFNSEGEDLIKEESQQVPGLPMTGAPAPTPGGQAMNQFTKAATNAAVTNKVM